jgi:hypothetical protein
MVLFFMTSYCTEEEEEEDEDMAQEEFLYSIGSAQMQESFYKARE